MSRIFIIMAAAFVAAFATPLEAQRTTPAAEAPAADVDIPFNPPLERKLIYRSTVVSNQRGPIVTVWTDYEITFSTRPDGYRMQVRAADIGSPTFTDAQRAEARRRLTETLPPYVLLLNAEGLVEEMENADAYWEAVVQAGLSAASAQSRGTDDQTLGIAADLIGQTSPEGRLAMLTQYIAPIVDFGGSSYTLGEALEAQVPLEGLMGMSFTQQATVRAERVDKGRLIVSMRATVPGEEIRRAMIALIARVPVTGQGRNTEAERARTEVQLRDARVERSSEANYEVALATGLIHRQETTDRTVIAIPGERTQTITQTIRIERQD